MNLLKNHIYLSILFLTISIPTFGNSRLVLDFNEFMEIVKNQHPIAHQSKLVLKKAAAKKLKARGGFDPKLESNYAEKQLQGKDYYSTFGAELKIPTWYGLNFSGGFQQNTGDFVNPAQSTSSSGLAYAGIGLAIGNGFLIDQRRAKLKEAKIYMESSAMEQKLILNKLFFSASKAYWGWFEAFHQEQVMKEAVTNAEQRFQVIKKNALLGESSIMDTVEAKAQVNSRLIKLQDYKLKLIKCRNILNLYLWSEGVIPLELENNVKPESITEGTLPILPFKVDSLLANHPKIGLLQNYIKTQDIAIKLSKEALKPTLNLKYNPLFENSQNGLTNFEKANYQVGFDFSYPIFTRKSRGEYRLQKIEKEQRALNLTIEQQTIKQTALTALKSWENYSKQEVTYKALNENYRKLAVGEAQLFKAGESSFFMVNSREKFYIESSEGLIKCIKLKNESLAYYRYSLCDFN